MCIGVTLPSITTVSSGAFGSLSSTLATTVADKHTATAKITRTDGIVPTRRVRHHKPPPPTPRCPALTVFCVAPLSPPL